MTSIDKITHPQVLAIVAKRQAALQLTNAGLADKINARIGKGDTHEDIANLLVSSGHVSDMPIERLVSAIRQGVTEGHFSKNHPYIAAAKSADNLNSWRTQNPDIAAASQRRASQRAAEVAGPRKFTGEIGEEIQRRLQSGEKPRDIALDFNASESAIKRLKYGRFKDDLAQK